MKKIKKLTWFAAFCALLQYTRERKLGGYLMANLLGCFVPALLLVLFLQGHIHWMAFMGINLAVRWIFAPLDEYSSDESAYCKLSTFPLQFWQMLYVRLVTKLLQIAEWLWAGATVYVSVVTFGGVWGSFFGGLCLMATSLSEELVFYAAYLVKNVKPYVAAIALACVGVGVATAVLPAGMCGAVAVAVAGGILALCLAVVVAVHLNFEKLRVLPGNGGDATTGKIPLSTRLMLSAAGGSGMRRLVCLEWVYMLKLKVSALVSALGYVVVFSVLDKTQSLLYVVIQYFIVDYCFLVGFNYFANINDREGMFLFCTIDRKTQIRSKNLALGAVLLVFSSLLTLVLGAFYGAGFKTLVLTVIGNLFSISMMLLICGVISITHFHLEESKKKYTVSNLLIMVLIMIVNSVLTAFLMAGGMLGAISLMFMIIMTLVGLYFSLVDMSLLETLFHKNQAKMVAALHS